MTVPGMSVQDFPRSGDLRVVTLNVWGAFYPIGTGAGAITPGAEPVEAWVRRQDALRAGLAALRPDLVAFQEVLHRADHDQVVDLLGGDYEVCHHPGRDPDGWGTSIASRWPIRAVRSENGHSTDRIEPHRITVAEIHCPDPVGPLLFVHPNPTYQLGYEHEREQQAVGTARIVEDLVDGDRPHVVLAGDFNAAPDTAGMRFWRGLQSLGGMSVCYRDAWQDASGERPGHTFTPDNALLRHNGWPQERGRRIDYILVRCNHYGPTLEVKACARIFDEPVDGVWATDHFGVVADLSPAS